MYAEEEQKVIVKGMFHDTNKSFNDDNDTCTNKQLIECRDLFRGVIEKEQAASNQKNIDFRSCDKLIVKMCVRQYVTPMLQQYVLSQLLMRGT